jgi:putative ABC transport system ATP-binding protein
MSSPASPYELIPTANGAASEQANHKPAAAGQLIAAGNGHRNGGPLIRLDQVVKAYQTPAGEFLALRGINLEIGRGEFVAVVGKSGSGKSTLINMITGIDRPTTGEIYIDNTPIHKLAEGPMAEWRGRNVGVIFQFFQLLPMLTVIENVMLPMDFCNMFKASEREQRALHLLEQVDMADQAYKLPNEVSGGQQQRAAIARALANDPPLLVADEPTGNLDSKTADQVFHLFGQMVDQGKTILMVTHDEDLAHQVRRMITIADGQIVDQEYFDRNGAALTEGADEPSAAPPSEPVPTPQEAPV